MQLNLFKKNFLTFFLLFFLLIIFSKFSISGDIEARLICIRDFGIVGEGCGHTIRYLFILQSFINFIVSFTDLIINNLNFLKNLSLDHKKIIYELFISICFYTIFIGIILVLTNIYFEKTKNYQNSIFLSLTFIFTSYIGNFLSFEHNEILISFLILLKLYNHEKKNSSFNTINLILDILICLSKIIYLPSIIILNYLFYKNNYKQLIFNTTIIIFLSSGYLYYEQLQITKFSDYTFNSMYKPTLDIFFNFKNFILIFLSPSIGLIVTAPLILISIIYNYNRFETKIKILSFLSLVTVLSLFYFWHGNGSSGSRYLFPILFIFYDEFRIFLKNFLKLKFSKIFILFVIISFLQSLNYHSPVLLYAYKDSKFSSDYKLLAKAKDDFLPVEKRFPKLDVRLSPQYFGWKIEILKLLNKEKLKIKVYDKEKIANLDEIVPNTLISRLYHISKYRNFDSDRINNYNLFGLFSYFKFNRFFYILILSCYLFLFFKIIPKKIEDDVHITK